MGTFQVTAQYVATAATSCRNTASDIQEELASLQTYIVNLEDWWQGIASTTFQDLMTEYQTYSTMLYNALSDIAGGLNGNYVNYTDTERANIATITSVQNALSTTNLS